MCNSTSEGGQRCDDARIHAASKQLLSYTEYQQLFKAAGRQNTSEELLSSEAFAQAQRSADRKLKELDNGDSSVTFSKAERRTFVHTGEGEKRSYKRRVIVKVAEADWEALTTLHPFLEDGDPAEFWQLVLSGDDSAPGNVAHGWQQYKAAVAAHSGSGGRRQKGGGGVLRSWLPPVPSLMQHALLEEKAKAQHRSVSEFIDARLWGKPISYFPEHVGWDKSVARKKALGG